MWKKKRNPETIHHIIGRCNRVRAKVEEDTNKTILNLFEHQALNTLFKDKQCPHEQLEVMYKIWENVLSDYAKEMIETLLDLSENMFYKENLLKW